MRGQSDIWRFPIDGSPEENTRNAFRVTRQSGQVQTPSVSPDGTEVVYLSDNGGHGNLWVTKADGTGTARQITFERDPATTIGVPLWSPSDNRIAFIVSRDRISIWLVNADGRNLRELVPRGLAPGWSPDGEWMYYSPLDNNEEWRIEKVPAKGGPPVVVRTDIDVHAPAVGRSVIYYARRAQRTVGLWDWEFRSASPEDGPSQKLTLVEGTRSPVSQFFASTTLSPDGRLARAPADRRRRLQRLRDAGRGRIVQAGDRLRRPADDHRPPGVVVTGRRVDLCGRRRDQQRHRPARRAHLSRRTNTSEAIVTVIRSIAAARSAAALRTPR